MRHLEDKQFYEELVKFLLPALIPSSIMLVYQLRNIYNFKKYGFHQEQCQRKQTLDQNFLCHPLGLSMDFHSFHGLLFFKKPYIKTFIVFIDDLKNFLYPDLPLKACIFESFDLCGFKNCF